MLNIENQHIANQINLESQINLTLKSATSPSPKPIVEF